MSWKKLLHGLTVRKNSGSNIGSRPRLNFIEGNNITLSVVDDAVGDEVDITVAASGSSSNLFAATYIMYKSGSTYYAKANSSTGLSDYSNVVFHTVLASVLSAIPAQGGKIYFMPGVYSVTGTTTGRSNVIFEGSGNHFGQGGTFFSLDANVDMFIFNAVTSEFEFSHINFDGNDRNYRIFNFNGTSDVAPIQDFAFTKCNFYHCRRAIYGLYAYDIHFTDVGFEQCGYLNTYAAVQAHTGCNFWHFKSCRWEALNGKGFYSSGTGGGYTVSHSFSFVDCKFHGLNTERYTCIYGHLFYSRIVGCLFFNVASANRAIYNQDKGLVISGNTFCCINGYAIELPTGADGCTITGNSFGGAFGDTTGGNPSWVLNNAADTALIGNSLFNHTHPLYSGSGTVVMDDYWGAGGGGGGLWTDYPASNYIKPDNQSNLRIGDINTKEWDLLIDKTTVSGSPFINKAAQFNLTNAQTGKLGWTIYTEIDSSSTHSDGSVAIYAKAITRGSAYWTAAVHGEVHDRMSSGVAIAGNFEMWNKHSNVSNALGVVSNINSWTGNPGSYYNGQAAFSCIGSGGKSWKYGLEFRSGSCNTAHIQSTGTDLILSANGGSSYIEGKCIAIKLQYSAPGLWLDETGSGKKGAFLVLDDLNFQIQRRVQGFGGYDNATPFQVNMTTGNGTFLGTVTASCGVLTCDYVFEDNYGLLPLNCLQKYIKRKKELPNFTINKGGSYSTENLREELVVKLEEQTLYILQLHERIKKLEN